MKKYLIAFSAVVAVVFVATSLNTIGDEDQNKNWDVVLASTEALTRGEGGGGGGNTGPAKVVGCSGGEHRKLCMCTNSKDCTETECY